MDNKKYDVPLSLKELDLISTCLASCSAQCFSCGNVSLANQYAALREKFLNIIRISIF